MVSAMHTVVLMLWFIAFCVADQPRTLADAFHADQDTCRNDPRAHVLFDETVKLVENCLANFATLMNREKKMDLGRSKEGRQRLNLARNAFRAWGVTDLEEKYNSEGEGRKGRDSAFEYTDRDHSRLKRAHGRLERVHNILTKGPERNIGKPRLVCHPSGFIKTTLAYIVSESHPTVLTVPGAYRTYQPT